MQIRSEANHVEPPDGVASEAADAGPQAPNYFDRLLARAVADGKADSEARRFVFEAYLDGKPNRTGRQKWTRSDRDALFWSSRIIEECTEADWSAEPAVLALASYLVQCARISRT